MSEQIVHWREYPFVALQGNVQADLSLVRNVREEGTLVNEIVGSPNLYTGRVSPSSACLKR